MNGSPETQRRRILEALHAGLAPISAVRALWLEGSFAAGTADDLSDIDVWLDVDDGHFDDALDWVAEILRRLGPLDLDYPRPHPHPLICQRFFHLVGTPEALTIDVCAQAHSRNFAFTLDVVHEVPLVLFDKTGVIRFVHTDRVAAEAQRRRRVDEVRQEYGLFRRWLDKSIRRGHFLEALAYYHGRVLVALVELLRLRHVPTKSDYHLKHADSDLPADVTRMLGKIYGVTSVADIVARLPDVDHLFAETLGALTVAADGVRPAD